MADRHYKMYLGQIDNIGNFDGIYMSISVILMLIMITVTYCVYESRDLSI